jgi:ComF family protein
VRGLPGLVAGAFVCALRGALRRAAAALQGLRDRRGRGRRTLRRLRAYAFPWSGLVAAFKFRAALDLAPALASLLSEAVRRSDAARPALLLPVPLSAERLAERGMNQAWELARRVGAPWGIDARGDVLRRLIDTPHLADLPREQRAARIRGALGVAPGQSHVLRGQCVALIDDVMTSGATAAEAARVLLAAGASEVQVWVVARTPAPGDT